MVVLVCGAIILRRRVHTAYCLALAWLVILALNPTTEGQTTALYLGSKPAQEQTPYGAQLPRKATIFGAKRSLPSE